MVGCSKELWNNSQEQLLVVVYVMPLGSDCDTPYFQLAAALEFCYQKPTILTISYKLYNRYSLTLSVLCSALLLC